MAVYADVGWETEDLYPEERPLYHSLWRTRSHVFRTQDVYETDRAIRIELELPGVPQDHLHIDVLERAVRVRVDRVVGYEGDDDTLRAIDETYSGFERMFDVPVDADPDRAEASFSRDTLTIVIPKIGHRRASIPVT